LGLSIISAGGIENQNTYYIKEMVSTEFKANGTVSFFTSFGFCGSPYANPLNFQPDWSMFNVKEGKFEDGLRMTPHGCATIRNEEQHPIEITYRLATWCGAMGLSPSMLNIAFGLAFLFYLLYRAYPYVHCKYHIHPHNNISLEFKDLIMLLEL